MDTVFYIIDGFEYRPYVDIEPDNKKIFHDCYKEGRCIKMPDDFYNFTPYTYMSQLEFSNFVRRIEVWIQG